MNAHFSLNATTPSSNQRYDRVGSTKVDPKRGGYFLFRNSLQVAAEAGIITPTAYIIAGHIARKPSDYPFTIGNLVRNLTMSRNTIRDAVRNLIQCGMAHEVFNSKGNSIGFHLNLNVEVILPETRGQNLTPLACQDFDPTPVQPANPTPVQSADPLYKNLPKERPASSLRSESGQTKTSATIATDRAGQVGFAFSDDQGIIPDQEIARIMTELRKLDIKGNPEDFELKRFVTDRIEFLTSDRVKNKLQRGGKETVQANRNRIIDMCMKIIVKPEHRWSSKRVDPVHQARAERIKQQISDLERKSQTYRMQDGTEIDGQEYQRRLVELRNHQDDLIRSRMLKRPASIDREEWRRKVEKAYSLEATAACIYGDKAGAYLEVTEDRIGFRKQILVLRQELSMMR